MGLEVREALEEREVLHLHRHPGQLGGIGKVGKIWKNVEKCWENDGKMLVVFEVNDVLLSELANFQNRVVDHYVAVSIGHMILYGLDGTCGGFNFVGVWKFEFWGSSWVSGNR